MASEDTLLVTGYALFAAIYTQRCQITAHHLQVLGWLSATICISSMLMLWSSKGTFKAALLGVFSYNEGWRLRFTYFAVVGGRGLALLGVYVLSIIVPFQVLRTKMPSNEQPAIALPAYCFMLDDYPPRFRDRTTNSGSPFWLSLLSLLLPLPPLVLNHICQVLLNSESPSREIIFVVGDFFGTFWSIVTTFPLLYHMFLSWTRSLPNIDPSTSETEWSFGQVVAMVVALVPFLAFFEAICGEFGDPKPERRRNAAGIFPWPSFYPAPYPIF